MYIVPNQVYRQINSYLQTQCKHFVCLFTWRAGGRQVYRQIRCSIIYNSAFHFLFIKQNGLTRSGKLSKKQDRPGVALEAPAPCNRNMMVFFPQCRRWTWLSRIFISIFISMCSLFYLLLSLKKETTLLLMLSVINKLSTLTAPSMIDFFLQISTCLIRPSLHCLIHFSKRLQWLKSK